ncbi:MAG: YigZ family protein [Spirochaetia bacterium]|nr:YigZ family protein [Spirochaetales bacterium]MDX9784226.1 YigZ family protein [Spirochaetia bacterium]
MPLGPARAEINVLNSRFIASLDYVETVDQARGFIASIRNEFSDATHNVPAFIVGGGNSRTEFCSDDGEPSGTSGRPLLAVLHGSGLGNVAVVVTRYFGGTLLGTGGLVRAYSEAGKLVLERTKRAVLTELNTIRLELPYSLFDIFKMKLPLFRATIVNEEFAEIIRLDVDVPSGEVDHFVSTLADLSSGGVKVRLLGLRTARLALSDNAYPSR